jgi:hypothetical protein
VYVGGGTVTLTDSTLSSNQAVGGAWARPDSPRAPGGGVGGGLYAVQTSSVTLRRDTVTDNSATDGDGTRRLSHGGGLRISGEYLDAFTVAHTTGNTPDDISGSYTLIT